MAEKKKRGFSAMSSEKQREMASKGGRAAHEQGKAHEWTPEEARHWGKKGVKAREDQKKLAAMALNPEGDVPSPSDDLGGRPDDAYR